MDVRFGLLRYTGMLPVSYSTKQGYDFSPCPMENKPSGQMPAVMLALRCEKDTLGRLCWAFGPPCHSHHREFVCATGSRVRCGLCALIARSSITRKLVIPKRC